MLGSGAEASPFEAFRTLFKADRSLTKLFFRNLTILHIKRNTMGSCFSSGEEDPRASGGSAPSRQHRLSTRRQKQGEELQAGSSTGGMSPFQYTAMTFL